MSPYVLGRLINALTAAAQSEARDWSTIGVFVALLGVVWYLPGVIVRGAKMLSGYRGAPAGDVAALEETLLRGKFPGYENYMLRVRKLLPWIY